MAQQALNPFADDATVVSVSDAPTVKPRDILGQKFELIGVAKVHSRIYNKDQWRLTIKLGDSKHSVYLGMAPSRDAQMEQAMIALKSGKSLVPFKLALTDRNSFKIVAA